MSRTDWAIGLNDRGREYVKGWEYKQFSTYDTAWNGRWPLMAYTKDEVTVVEFVQASPWASGPHYFLGLCGPYGPVSSTLWTEDEIDEVM